jgi:integrase/recombinase XerD
MGQRNASPHTIANYRDTFRLLLAFGCRGRGLKKTPAALSVQDLDAPLIVRFLDHLEKQRNNTPQSRNVRLAAIHSFFQYVALREPGLGAVAQRVLAIPSKRCTKKPVDFLSRAETEALLKAPDQNTWSGRRDHAWLLVAVQTGLRVSELIGLRCQDVACGSGAHVRCTGKGRKTRCVPLRKDTVRVLRLWLKEQAANGPRQTVPAVPQSPRKRVCLLLKTPNENLLSIPSPCWRCHPLGRQAVPRCPRQRVFRRCRRDQAAARVHHAFWRACPHSTQTRFGSYLSTIRSSHS